MPYISLLVILAVSILSSCTQDTHVTSAPSSTEQDSPSTSASFSIEFEPRGVTPDTSTESQEQELLAFSGEIFPLIISKEGGDGYQSGEIIKWRISSLNKALVVQKNTPSPEGVNHNWPSHIACSIWEKISQTGSLERLLLGTADRDEKCIPKEIHILGSYYVTKDQKNVYIDGKILEGADPVSFSHYRGIQYGGEGTNLFRDKNNIYYDRGTHAGDYVRADDIDPDNLRWINRYFVYDESSIYYFRGETGFQKLPGMTPEYYVLLDDYTIRNDKYIYSRQNSFAPPISVIFPGNIDTLNRVSFSYNLSDYFLDDTGTYRVSYWDGTKDKITFVKIPDINPDQFILLNDPEPGDVYLGIMDDDTLYYDNMRVEISKEQIATLKMMIQKKIDDGDPHREGITLLLQATK